MIGDESTLVIDGITTNASMTPNDLLARAVMISLFSWRRAQDGDVGNGDKKYGWWGDNYADVVNDKIGSRLWLLARSKLTLETLSRAREYAIEALQWLLDDGVASDVSVTAERNGNERLDLWIVITRGDGSKLDLRFSDLWSNLNV